jgi:hypothetical protein
MLLALAAAAQAGTGRVRQATKAGTWYPGNAKTLRRMIEGYFAKAPKGDLGGPAVALIAPHAGYRFSGRCAAAGYALLRGQDVRRVIVLAPSHHVAFRGGSIADADAYETPLGKVPLDRGVCDALLRSPLVRNIPTAHAQEHSLELQVPFLQVALKEFKLVPIVLSRLGEDDGEAFAKILRPHVDAHTVIVASSDFTHYGRMFGYTPFTRNVRENIAKLDQGAVKLALKLDAAGFRRYVREKRATICGHVPIAVMLETLTPDCRGKQIGYYLSGDEQKDYRHSVSYASVAFAIGRGQVSEAGRKTLLGVARKTLRATLKGDDLPDFDIDAEELGVRRGVFVTYKNGGRLRGCIGRFQSDEALWKTVREMAVAAARDPRFRRNPITVKEERQLGITVSILSPITRIRDPLHFIPGIHGLYVRRGRRAGTYLPQVATELKADRETFISHLCRYKIGLAADAWKDPRTEVYIYSAQVFGYADAAAR